MPRALLPRSEQTVTAFRELGTGRTWGFPDTFRPFWLGRGGACQVRIPRLGLHAPHCELVYVGGRLHLRDLSGDGLLVGRRRVSEARPLPGDVIGMAGLSFLAMSANMIGAASTLAQLVGLDRHAEIEAALQIGLRESTIVVIDPTGQVADRAAVAIASARSSGWCIEWAVSMDPPKLRSGGNVERIAIPLTKDHLFEDYDLRPIRRWVESGRVRLTIGARRVSDVEDRVGRIPHDIPVIHVPSFEERRRDILPIFEKELNAVDRALTLQDVGEINVVALQRYAWPNGVDEIASAARRIAGIFAGGGIDKARNVDLGRDQLRAWIKAVGLSFGDNTSC